MFRHTGFSGIHSIFRAPGWYFIVWAVLAAFGCSIREEPPADIPGAEVRFTEADRERILEYFSQYEFPPGIQDPSVLAPDLEERIAKTGKIPPGVAAMPLPAELERQLSEIPPRFSRFLVGDDVVLMDVNLREVYDTVPDVLR